MSRHSRASGPGEACGTSALGSGEAILPYAGLEPYRPLRAAGIRTEPPMSDPSARVVIPAASAAADPPDEPPGVNSGFHGLRVIPHKALQVTARRKNSGAVV